MSAGPDGDRDYVLALRGYGRILLSLGFVAVALAVLVGSQGSGRTIARAWVALAGGGICVLAGAWLLGRAR